MEHPGRGIPQQVPQKEILDITLLLEEKKKKKKAVDVFVFI